MAIFNFNKTMLKLGINRLFLHASELQFLNPITKKLQTVTVPLDEELANKINAI